MLLNFFSLPYYEIKPLHIFTSQGNNFVKFGKNENGYWRIFPDGTIIQTIPSKGRVGIYNFPIPFKEKVEVVIATNSSKQGEAVDNVFAYPVNLASYYCAAKSTYGKITGFHSTLIAIGK